jgi:hypothetical protein
MKPNKKNLIVTLAFLAGVVQTNVRAASLLLDFGPTVTLPADAQKSPGHVVGAVPGTEIS